VIAFRLSDDDSFFTGVVLPVDGSQLRALRTPRSSTVQQPGCDDSFIVPFNALRGGIRSQISAKTRNDSFV
jgi:hypothetical protein